MSRTLTAILLIAAALPLRADRIRVVVAVGHPESRRASLVSVRNEVAESLDTASHFEPWGRSAAFAAEIDSAELEALSHDPRVRAITIDRGGEGALLESLPFVGADLVHARGIDGHGVTVAVLDSGIDAKSPDFAGRIVAQQCFCDNFDGTGCCPNGEVVQSGDGAARDDNGHGTHVSGIVAGGGVTAPRGLAPGARIVAVKVLDHNRAFGSFTQIYRALEWILNERPDVRVINMSFGSWAVYAPSACDTAAVSIGMQDVIASLRERGVLITASSGNQSDTAGATIPACMADVLAVGATSDVADEITPFTNSGPAIDLLAPGSAITAASRGGGFATMSGTSMAAPHVAGAIALMQQVSAGTLSAAKAEGILKLTGRPVVDARNGLAFPRLDVLAAIAATPYVPPPPPHKRRSAKK